MSCVCFVIVQLYLHENVIFSVCARMGNAAYIIFIMWNSIFGVDAWYNFRFNISCGVAVKVRSHQENFLCQPLPFLLKLPDVFFMISLSDSHVDVKFKMIPGI